MLLFLALISFNSFCARQWFLTYISYAVVAMGAVVLVWRVSHIRDYLNSKIWILLVFVASYIFGSINTLEYGFMENLQGVIWMCLQYFAVFAFDVKSDSAVREYEFSLITKFYLLYTGVMAAVSLYLMLIKYSSYEIVDNYYVVAAGFNFHRLWGCYNDPNYGAIFAIVSIYLSFYYLRTVTDLKIKVLLYLNLFCEYLYICYSDSRTGQVALFFSSFALIYGVLIKNANGIKWFGTSGWKNVAACMLVSFLAASVILGGVFTVQRLSSMAQMKTTEQTLIEQGVTGEELEAAVDENRIGREEDEINDGDTSNNRFAIWAFGLDVFRENPVFGVSFRNIREYAVDVMPEAFNAQGGI